MSLDALLARLEARAVTPVTCAVFPNVTPEPQRTPSCTSVTSVTSVTDRNTGAAKKLALRNGGKKILTPSLNATDWRAYFDERAAIMEFDGGLSRAEAEAQAQGELDVLRNKRIYH